MPVCLAVFCLVVFCLPSAVWLAVCMSLWIVQVYVHVLLVPICFTGCTAVNRTGGDVCYCSVTAGIETEGSGAVRKEGAGD